MVDRWYVVRTKPNKELLAAVTIAAAGFHAFVPVTLVERSHAGKRERVSRPLFPRYLFVQFDREAQRFGQLNYCRGVSNRGLMCDADDLPIFVPDPIIDSIRERERQMKAKAGEVTTGYEAGESFPIQVGPWAQFMATYIGEDHGKVFATIPLFGTDHLVTLDFEAVPICSTRIDKISG